MKSGAKNTAKLAEREAKTKQLDSLTKQVEALNKGIEEGNAQRVGILKHLRELTAERDRVQAQIDFLLRPRQTSGDDEPAAA